MTQTILYSFRRCPYAIRARYALAYSGINYELREVDLKNKPKSLLDLSAKGTVPVLKLPSGTILDESIAIIKYAITQNDPENWDKWPSDKQKDIDTMIAHNDNEFVHILKKYKYHEHHPQHSQQEYRHIAQNKFIAPLDNLLMGQSFFLGKRISIADVAIFPFIRQFAMVDSSWFSQSHYANLQRWLSYFLDHPIFECIMQKHHLWKQS